MNYSIKNVSLGVGEVRMDKKIVFFDIDGTIYKYDCGIPNDTAEAIRKLKDNGHIPVICTGRTKCMIYSEHMSPGFTHIVAGAGTYVEIDGREAFLAEMAENEARRVIAGFLENKFVPIAEGKNNIYLGTDISDLTESNKYVFKVYKENIGQYMKTINEPQLSVSKVSALFTNHSNLEGMIKEFSQDYLVVNHRGNLLELIPKGFSKAQGIERMINELNIDHKNTYAFGDSLNDLDMLEYVNVSCAMGNSDRKVKEISDYVTDDFDKGGITKGLKHFGLI